MIPLRQTVYRNLTRTNLAKVRSSGIFISRLQSNVAPAQKAAVPPVADTARSNDSQQNNELNNAKDSKPKRKYPQINSKLRDVTTQIREVVKTSSGDLSEATEILEEGLSYLREIQVAEKISNKTFFHEFQPVATELVYKSLGSSQNPQDILDILVQYGVAHKYHFILVAAHLMQSSANKIDTYHEVLKLWVKHVEYEKSIDFFYSFPYVIKDSGIDFKGYHLINLAYFSYVQSCLQGDVQFKFDDATKLLQSEVLPSSFFVNRTLFDLKLLDKYSHEYSAFTKAVQSEAHENLDPNGIIAYRRIDGAAERKDSVALNRIYSELSEASVKSNRPITEATVNRFMKAFLDCGKPDEIFAYFQALLQNGVQKPAMQTWDLVLRAMAHPAYIQKKSSNKEQIAQNVVRTVETIVQQVGEANLSPKTLSIIVSCFANLDRFDLVDQYLERFAHVPMINPIKNNILVGLVLNNKIEEAEQKLHQFVNDGSGYVPITATMNTFLSHYAKIKNYKAIEGILQFMKLNNIAENVATYTIVIDIYFKLHRSKGLSANVDELLSSITKSPHVSLNDFTYTSIIDGLVKDGQNIEAARQIYDGAVKKFKNSAQLYTVMLKGELDFGSVGRAQLIFDRYIKMISNDTRIWNTMITSLLAKHEDLALEYYYNLKNQTSLKVEPNFFTYYFLISHFLKRGNKEKVQFFIDEMRDLKLAQMGNELPKILKSLMQDYSFPRELSAELAKFA